MGSSYTNTKRKSSKPSKSQILLKRVLYTGAIVLACAAIYSSVKSILAPETSMGEIGLPHGSIQELVNPKTFMSAYIATNCKPPLLETTQTIRVAGKIDSGHANESFVLIKKQPNLMLFTIDRKTHQITFGVHGDKVWRRVRIPNREDEFINIEGDEVHTWKSQARFYDRIIQAHLGDGSILNIEPSEWENIDCLKVKLIDGDGDKVDIFIDPLTMHPLAEKQYRDNGAVQQTTFSDYRDIDGMPIPFNMVTTVDGEVLNRIELESAALNTGIMSRLFEVPDSLL